MYTEAEIQQKKEKIFAVAIHCFIEHGYTGTNMLTIARLAGISKGGLYHYFPSKKTLFLELFEYRVNHYFEEITAFLSDRHEPETQIKLLVIGAGTILKQHAEFYRFSLEFLAMGARDEEIRAAMTRFHNRALGTFTRIIRQGCRQGAFKPVDPEKIARSFYLVIMGAFFTQFSVNVTYDLKEQNTFDMDNILNAIRAT